MVTCLRCIEWKLGEVEEQGGHVLCSSCNGIFGWGLVCGSGTVVSMCQGPASFTVFGGIVKGGRPESALADLAADCVDMGQSNINDRKRVAIHISKI